jgi:hypothetical protein
LASESAVDVTSQVAICAGGTALFVLGSVVDAVGVGAQDPTDLSDPGVLIAITRPSSTGGKVLCFIALRVLGFVALRVLASCTRVFVNSRSVVGIHTDGWFERPTSDSTSVLCRFERPTSDSTSVDVGLNGQHQIVHPWMLV